MVGRLGSLGHLFDQIQVKYVKNIVMTITIEVTVAKTGPRTVGYTMANELDTGKRAFFAEGAFGAR